MSSTLTDYLSSRVKRIRPKKKVEEKTGFTMRPLKLLARQVAIKRGGMPVSTREVTKAVVEDQKFAFRHGWNQTVLLVGGPGEGKSKAAFLLSDIWTKMTGGKRKTSWNISEIPELNDGDWLHVDEWLFIMGAGSRLALESIKNLFALGRAKMICISVSTPTSPNIPFMTFEATTLAQDFDARRNLFEIRVPLPRYGLVYVGNAILPLGEDDKDWAAYELESYERKTGVMADKGEMRVTSEFDNLEVAKEVRKWASDKGLFISTKGQAKAALNTMAEERKIKLNYSIEENIANLIVMQVRSGTGQPAYVGQTTDLREALYTRLGERGVKNRYIEWLRLYVGGEIQTDIATKFKVTQEAISQAIGTNSDLRVNNLGYAFEDVWVTKLRADGVKVIKGGENTPEPDVLIQDELGNIIEVQSVKCHISKSTTITININKIAKSELKLLDEGVPVKLIFYDVVANKLFSVDVSRKQEKYKFTKS